MAADSAAAGAAATSRVGPTIRRSLTAAVCTLIGTAAAGAVDAVDYDASMLYYSEGYRLSVNEGVLNVRKSLANDRALSFQFTYDIMTGATPNGALPSPLTQTFTRPSGAGAYVVAPGVLPLDDTFQDNRAAASLTWETPIGRRSRASLGASHSIEYDYASTAADIGSSRDFNKRNTTLAARFAYAYDELTPKGGVPVPFASMDQAGGVPMRAGRTAFKRVGDAMVSLTQVLDRKTVARLAWAATYGSGDQTDPYKVLSLVHPPTGPAAGDPLDYLYERRPDTRLRQSVTALVKRHLGRGAVDATYRYYTDDWGVRAHSAELRYRFALANARYLQPQVRFYHQGAADFYRPFLRSDETLPDYASADYRLGAMDAYTIAIKYGIRVEPAHEINVRLGYYRQMGDSSPPEAFGGLTGLDLFPTVQSYIVQIGYSSYFDR